MSYTKDQLLNDLESKNKPILVFGDGKWGESGWKFLYTCILSYKNDIPHLKEFLNCLEFVLPCEECQMHYRDYKVKNPIPDNVHYIFFWLCKLENQILKRKGKKPINRLEYISKISSVRTAQDKVKPKKAKKVNKPRKQLPNAPCVNCNQSRASLGVTSKSMGLGNIGRTINGGYRL